MIWRSPIGGIVILLVLASCASGPYVPPEAETTHDNAILQDQRGAYVDPGGPALVWARNNPNDDRSAKLAAVLESQPSGIIIGGGEDAAEAAIRVQRVSEAARAVSDIPVFVVDEPGPADCASVESIGLDRPQLMDALKAAIGDGPAVVVLDPKGVVVQEQCPQLDQRSLRGDLRAAIKTFDSSKTSVLLGVGTGIDRPAEQAASKIDRVLVPEVVGLMFNYGGQVDTAAAKRWAKAVRSEHKGADLELLVDSGRSGRTTREEPCELDATRAGQRAFLTGTTSYVKTMWLTSPGITDANCPRGSRSIFDPSLAWRQLRLGNS